MNIFVGLILSILLSIIPLTIWAALLTLFDRYEREPPLLMLGVFLWGFFIAIGVSFILNTVFNVSLYLASGSEGLSMLGTAVISAPLVEETLKGLGVFLVFAYFRHEFDSVLDGVIYGSLVAFGFAAAEDVQYLFLAFVEGGAEGLAFITFFRILLLPFAHAFYTSFTGIGLAVGRLSRGPLRFFAPAAGYATAITMHALHNLFASFAATPACLLGIVGVEWIGFLGMFAFIVGLVVREGRIMREQLREEVALGHLTQTQYDTACSVGGQMGSRLGAIVGGRWRDLARFYNLCGELAFKKYQLARLGPEREREAQATIDRLRTQIRGVAGKA